jgi:superfamily I DNA/RNA helicase
MIDKATLLAAPIGSVIAPAGCGKTDLIAQAVAEPAGAGSLILTHTHSGVRAIRDRLQKLGVDRRRARVETIAGWCLRYATAYPITSVLPSKEPVKQEWDEVYAGAVLLLETRAVQSVVKSSYSRVFVDEYQDCTELQHTLISALAKLIPTYVLGDPLQGIFGFGGGCLPWEDTVEETFPPLGSLNFPWRWKGKNEALGHWLLDIREPLTTGGGIDLSSAPITWKQHTPENLRTSAYELTRAEGSIVAIRKWANDAHSFARSFAGVYPSMEEVECNDLLSFAKDMDTLAGPSRAARLIRFAGECLTEVMTTLSSVLDKLDAGVLPEPHRYRTHGDLVSSLLAVAQSPDFPLLRKAMMRLEEVPNAKLFRRELWREAARTIHEREKGHLTTLRQAAWSVRNRSRLAGRAVDTRSVSRTLLIKGLEFDHAIIPNANEFEDGRRPGDGARNFYVAATRGSRSLVILSSDPRVRFSAPTL